MGKRRKRSRKHKKDRKVRRGVDFNKVAKIFKTLFEAQDWMTMRRIAMVSGLKEGTTRHYLVKHLDKFIDVQEVVPDLRLKLVKLKPGVSYNRVEKWLKIKEKLKDHRKA